jgi:hypothetical protein
MKKIFGSLTLGFGAALGVFVALAMPPGGWGVAVGVGLGLLGCLPLLLIMMMLIGRGNIDRRSQVYEESQPVIIIQHPGGYDPLPGYAPEHYAPQPRGYMGVSDHYGYTVEPPRQRRIQQAAPQTQRQLPSSRRKIQRQAYYSPEMAYPPEDYYAGEDYGQEAAYYYDTPQPQPARYDAYYGSRNGQAQAYYNEVEAVPERFRPAPARRPARVPSYREEAVEAQYRTIGEGD